MPINIVKIIRNGVESKHWYLRGTYKGVVVDKSTGETRYDFAENEKLKTENEIHNSVVNGIKKSITFGKGADLYLKGGGNPRYIGKFDEDEKRWTGLLGQFFFTEMSRITQSVLDDAAKKAYPGVKPQTLNRQFYAPFVTVWNFCVQEGLVHEKKWRRPKVKKSDKKKTKWFRHEDAGRFYKSASRHLRAIQVFMTYTGARPSEAIELGLESLDLVNSWAVLNATKTDSLRGVPLHPAVVKELREYIGKRRVGRVFLTNAGKPYKSHRDKDGYITGGGYFKTSWNSTIRRANKASPDSPSLSGYTPYGMRHTLNNWLIMADIEPSTREAIMGHDNGSTNVIYSDVPQSHLIATIAKLPDFTGFTQQNTKKHALFTLNSAQKRRVKKRGKVKKNAGNKGGAAEWD